MIADLLFNGKLIEYNGVVTQLAATSEVATIGLILTVPTGERVFMLNMTSLVNDLAAGKTINQFIRSADASSISQQSTSLDNQFDRFAVAQTNAGVSVAQVDGMYNPTIMGGGMSWRVDCQATLDADKIITVRGLYWTREHLMASSVLGAGISISSEVHKEI